MALYNDFNSYPESGFPVLSDVSDRFVLNTLYSTPLRIADFKIDIVGNTRLLGTLTIGGFLNGVTSLTMAGSITGATGITSTAMSTGLMTITGNGNLVMTGSIGSSLFRPLKVWTKDFDSTNMPTVNGDSLLGIVQSTPFPFITLASPTQTTSSPVLNATQIWNNVATTFTGMKFNVTDTASATASMLVDIQVGGVSKWSLRKDGFATSTGLTVGTLFDAGNNLAGIALGATRLFGWGSSGFVSPDVIMGRAGAANLRFGNVDAASPVAQTLSTQGSRSGTDTNVGGANLTIQSGNGTGTGTPSSLILQAPVVVGSGTGAQTMTTFLTGTGTLATFAVPAAAPQIYNADFAIAASGNAATVTRAYRNNVVTNNSAATLTVTLSTTSAAAGDMVIVQILDFSAAAQTLTLVNTENSTVTPPATTNGSTTLPLTLGFKWNALTSKWRLIASA